MKKLFTFLLALIASVGIASAQSGTCGDNLTWEFDAETGILTISGTGAMADYAYASKTPWYSSRSAIKTVLINDGLTSIGEYAFGETGIYKNAANRENGVLYINDCLIDANNSVSGAYIIKEGTRLIGDDAFASCWSLTSVTIPNSVTSIGDHAFQDCSSLTSINVVNDNPNYSSVDGVLFNKDKTTLIQYPIDNTRSEYTIPNSVTSIGEQAFRDNSSLTSVNIPNSVTSIGSSAFSSCSSLTSVTIPNSVTSIGSSAFYRCSSLTSVTIGESVTSIGGYAFYNCSSLTSSLSLIA